MYQRFKMTPSATRKVLFWGALIPFLTYQAAVYTDVSFDLAFSNMSDLTE